MAINPVIMELKVKVKEKAGEEAESVEEDAKDVELGVEAEEGVTRRAK